MVTVSIFTLRDVIRRMQVQFKIPHNGNSHTSPSTEKDIQDIRTYLENQALQSYHPKRENNEWADVSRDLMESGAAYANTARAFRNFKCNTQKATNNGVPEGAPAAIAADSDLDADAGVDHGLGGKGLSEKKIMNRGRIVLYLYSICIILILYYLFLLYSIINDAFHPDCLLMQHPLIYRTQTVLNGNRT